MGDVVAGWCVSGGGSKHGEGYLWNIVGLGVSGQVDMGWLFNSPSSRSEA